jgi:hypothetical protein
VDRQSAGAYLGISVRSVQSLHAAGKLQPVKLLGRKLLFDVHDLDALVDQVKVNGRI